MDRPSLPIPRKSRRVSFSDDVKTYYTRPPPPDDIPVVISSSYGPPPTPQLKSRPLPDSPDLAPSHLEQAHPARDGTAHHTHTKTTLTPANSPATQPVPVATPTLSPSSTASGSSALTDSDTAEPESDLSPYLARFPVEWNVREMRSPAGMPRSGCLRAPAFRSGRTTCAVHFVPDPTERRDDWQITVYATRSLTVGDVVGRIGEELYKVDDGMGIYEGHPREHAARAERMSRVMGDLDAANDRLRAIDLYSERRSHFLGLEQVVADDGSHMYIVRLGRPE
ncbi:hypothetical protein C8Q76DRAFT_266179 [Earliella scabrosa]|nr:hypothetical protein C8Q76DRAFT_266179 [Earliella scabrosa]